MMKIYLDILILTNLFVTYFLVLSTKVLLHRSCSKKRMFLASLAGALGAGAMIFPTLSPVLTAVFKLVLSTGISMIAFGVKPWTFLIKNTVGFYAISFIYAGMMLALWYFVTPIGMQFKNGVAYFNVSPGVLIISTVVSFLFLQGAGHFIKKTPTSNQILSITIGCQGNTVTVKAFIDTGNRAADLMTGLPVVFCELPALKTLMPTSIYDALKKDKMEDIVDVNWKTRMRMIPMSVVIGQGLIPAFRPDYLLIEGEDNGQNRHAIVAVSQQLLSDGEFSMIVGENLIHQS